MYIKKKGGKKNCQVRACWHEIKTAQSGISTSRQRWTHQQSSKMGFKDFYVLMTDFASMMSMSPSLPLLKCQVMAHLSISSVGHMYAGNAPPAASGRLTLAQYLKNKTARADRFGPAPAG